MSDKELINHILSHGNTQEMPYYKELVASFGCIPSLQNIDLEIKKGYAYVYMKYYLDKDHFSTAKKAVRFGSITLNMFNGSPEPKILATAIMRINLSEIGLSQLYNDSDVQKIDFYQAVTEQSGYNIRELVGNTSKDGASITSCIDAKGRHDKDKCGR